MDKNTFKLVWTGTAESILPTRASKLPAVIEEGMTKLFAAMLTRAAGSARAGKKNLHFT